MQLRYNYRVYPTPDQQQARLVLRPGVELEPVVYGGGQEHGLRAGTENVALAVALGTAATLAAAELANGGHLRLRALRDRLTNALSGRVVLNGHPDRRLPQTVNISITGVSGEDLLAAVPGVAASTGSACNAGSRQPHPVLAAMGLPDTRSLAALRLSLGRWSTPDDADAGHRRARHRQATVRAAGRPLRLAGGQTRTVFNRPVSTGAH